MCGVNVGEREHILGACSSESGVYSRVWALHPQTGLGRGGAVPSPWHMSSEVQGEQHSALAVMP
jgi:hypothetical protein